MADVTLRKLDTLEEVTVDESAAPFFRNQGFVQVADTEKKPQSPTNSKNKE